MCCERHHGISDDVVLRDFSAPLGLFTRLDYIRPKTPKPNPDREASLERDSIFSDCLVDADVIGTGMIG